MADELNVKLGPFWWQSPWVRVTLPIAMVVGIASAAYYVSHRRSVLGSLGGARG